MGERDKVPERVNVSMTKEMRDRIEAWRSWQYTEIGEIPRISDAMRILLHKGLRAEGFQIEEDQTDE